MAHDIHSKIYRFFISYGYALAFIGLMCIWAAYNITVETDTSGIIVSDNKTELTCAQDIHIYNGKNAADFLQQLSEYEGMAFKCMICTVDALYDGSEEDKQAIRHFVDKKLSFWPFRRKDIEDYFLRKIQTEKVRTG